MIIFFNTPNAGYWILVAGCCHAAAWWMLPAAALVELWRTVDAGGSPPKAGCRMIAWEILPIG